MHMEVHDELTICIEQGLKDHINLKFFVSDDTELLKLLKVFDHYQIMILD